MALLMRERVDPDTVKAYTAALTGDPPAQFPTITVIKVGKRYKLVCGFHRYTAHKEAGLTEILADICEGDADDAVMYAARDNAYEGKARTNADKRVTVKALLACPRWAGMTNSAIGKAANVDHKTVTTIRSEVGNSQPAGDSGGADSPPAKRRGLDGKLYPAKATRARKAAAAAAAAPSDLTLKERRVERARIRDEEAIRAHQAKEARQTATPAPVPAAARAPDGDLRLMAQQCPNGDQNRRTPSQGHGRHRRARREHPGARPASPRRHHPRQPPHRRRAPHRRGQGADERRRQGAESFPHHGARQDRRLRREENA
jgi:hypothetical protein